MCYIFGDRVWRMRITFGHRLGRMGLFAFTGTQKTRPGQARPKGFSMKLKGELASSLRGEKPGVRKKKFQEIGRREKVKDKGDNNSFQRSHPGDKSFLLNIDAFENESA